MNPRDPECCLQQGASRGQCSAVYVPDSRRATAAGNRLLWVMVPSWSACNFLFPSVSGNRINRKYSTLRQVKKKKKMNGHAVFYVVSFQMADVLFYIPTDTKATSEFRLKKSTKLDLLPSKSRTNERTSFFFLCEYVLLCHDAWVYDDNTVQIIKKKELSNCGLQVCTKIDESRQIFEKLRDRF